MKHQAPGLFTICRCGCARSCRRGWCCRPPACAPYCWGVAAPGPAACQHQLTTPRASSGHLRSVTFSAPSPHLRAPTNRHPLRSTDASDAILVSVHCPASGSVTLSDRLVRLRPAEGLTDRVLREVMFRARPRTAGFLCPARWPMPGAAIPAYALRFLQWQQRLTMVPAPIAQPAGAPPFPRLLLTTTQCSLQKGHPACMSCGRTSVGNRPRNLPRDMVPDFSPRLGLLPSCPFTNVPLPPRVPATGCDGREKCLAIRNLVEAAA